MAHDDDELTNPGRGPLVSDFDEDDGQDGGTEEVTQVDTLNDHVNSDRTPSGGNPFPPPGIDDDDSLLPPE